MKCTYEDGGDVRITHVFNADDGQRTKRGICNVCGRVYTVLELLMRPSESVGAMALASEIKKGKARMRLDRSV